MTVNRAPAVHRYTVDIAVPTGADPDGALNRALASMSSEAGCPNRVYARKQPSGLVVTDIDNAPDGTPACCTNHDRHLSTGETL